MDKIIKAYGFYPRLTSLPGCSLIALRDVVKDAFPELVVEKILEYAVWTKSISVAQMLQRSRTNIFRIEYVTERSNQKYINLNRLHQEWIFAPLLPELSDEKWSFDEYIPNVLTVNTDQKLLWRRFQPLTQIQIYPMEVRSPITQRELHEYDQAILEKVRLEGRRRPISSRKRNEILMMVQKKIQDELKIIARRVPPALRKRILSDDSEMNPAKRKKMIL